MYTPKKTAFDEVDMLKRWERNSDARFLQNAQVRRASSQLLRLQIIMIHCSKYLKQLQPTSPASSNEQAGGWISYLFPDTNKTNHSRSIFLAVILYIHLAPKLILDSEYHTVTEFHPYHTPNHPAQK
jgi:hypothetical protein